MEDEDDDRQQAAHDGGHQREKKSSFVIQIPSYKEVIDTTQSSQPPPPSSLFTPSPSFSQAFNFIKNSEFYSPPPPPPPPSTAAASTSRPFGNQPEAPSLSSSAVASSSSTTSQIANNRNAILVSHRQKGNPLLKHIRNVRWAFADVVCDYILGQSTCALYLSLRYHLLHPDYLYYRIRELPKTFKLRVVLCHVDVEDVVKPLLEVTKTALLHDCTLLCAWRYLLSCPWGYADYSICYLCKDATPSIIRHCGLLLEKTIQTSDSIGFVLYEIIQLFCMSLQVPLELYH